MKRKPNMFQKYLRRAVAALCIICVVLGTPVHAFAESGGSSSDELIDEDSTESISESTDTTENSEELISEDSPDEDTSSANFSTENSSVGATISSANELIEDSDERSNEDISDADLANEETTKENASEDMNISTASKDGTVEHTTLSKVRHAAKMKAAVSANIASGTWGTCPWTIDKTRDVYPIEYTLTIGAGTGAEQTQNASPWDSYKYQITSVKISGKVTAPQNCSYLFSDLQSVETIDLSNFDTSKVTDMSHMFYYCSNLTSLDVSHFDTSKVTDMNFMFGGGYHAGCNFLTTLDVSGWDTGNVTDMGNMFNGCSILKSLDVSHFDTS
ncbi:MAG: BspA family leucine-rich repeat surface protein, partial [Roseburia faecis]|nr:BspA family leucine-rich repeat surface protein [Roseburia faecis]